VASACSAIGFMRPRDAHLLALDMRTGGILFDVQLADLQGRLLRTVAPLVDERQGHRRDCGAEFGSAGSSTRTTCKPASAHGVLYRRRPVNRAAGHGRKVTVLRGGGSIWVPGLRSQQNLVFFGTGNPGPDYNSNAREGDNLFTTSLFALDADTGRLAGTISSPPTTCKGLGFDAVPVLPI